MDDPKKIKLNTDEAIVFMGSMNAMPMMYAIELRKMGYEVIYLVDRPRGDTLSRPENHFPDINYPYPAWIVECAIPSQVLVSLFPRLFAAILGVRIRKATSKRIQCYVLNGFFSSLSPYLVPGAAKVALSHGSDLDTWADTDNLKRLTDGMRDRSIFRWMPLPLAKRLIRKVVAVQFCGYMRSSAVVYFPLGFNATGDQVIERLVRAGVRYVARYDISVEPLRGQPRGLGSRSETINIFCGVRFLYRTFPDGNVGYSKGNDIIIRGLALYLRRNRKLCIHFVEKGEDVNYAKQLCQEMGLDDVVVWHKEMPFSDLLRLYRSSDICFDQVGSHWIGAIGAYALWLGKPLIANAGPAVRAGVWPPINPICSATSATEVSNWLVRLEEPALRSRISEDSQRFVEKYMSPLRTLNDIFDFERT